MAKRVSNESSILEVLQQFIQQNRLESGMDKIDAEQAWMILESAKLLADTEMFPYFKAFDETPASYDGKGGVKTHPQLKKIIQMAAAQSWIGGAANFEHGGMQLPEMIFNTGQHIFQAANNSVQGYIGLSTGAADLITSFGNKTQIEKAEKL